MNKKEQPSQQSHKRRVRYSGTHPKRYEEKYKELQPEKYPETISRVMEKGSTPAGMHISIMVEEILDFLQIQPGQNGLDATLGYGGHTSAMLKKLQQQGHIYALDIDPIEALKTTERLQSLGFGSEILTVLHKNFSEIDEISKEMGPFHFVLADLGVSSMQIDNPERGFSFKKEGPLDLRLNPDTGISAAERLQSISFPELKGMLIENADEPYADEIARAILSSIKKGGAMDTTTALQKAIGEALSFLPAKERTQAIQKSCQRTFQALRIDINEEYEALEQFMQNLPEALLPGGRVAVLTFHSGEDRIVKKAFKSFYQSGVYKEISTQVLRPSAAECSRNGRARSTKLRWAIKA